MTVLATIRLPFNNGELLRVRVLNLRFIEILGRLGERRRLFITQTSKEIKSKKVTEKWILTFQG